MKKILLTMVVAVAVVGVASADLTQWDIKGGVATDQNGDAFANLTATGLTFINVGAEFDGATININVLQSLVGKGGGGIPLGVGPAFLGGVYAAGGFEDDASAIAIATFLVVNRAGITGVGDIVAGDFVGVSAVTFEPTERWPVGDPAPGLPDSFVLGDIQTGIEVVIPEPATFGLLGLAGLGMFLARKKARR